VVLIYLTAPPDFAELRQLRSAAGAAPVVLWGPGLDGESAFQAMQLGARGILPVDTPVEGLFATLHNVHRGVLCCERNLMEGVLFQPRVILTGRECQIVSLVAQGFKNKQIATTLGLTEGTVKVYLYRLFRKLGISDRLNMALYGVKNLFQVPPAASPGTARSPVRPRLVPEPLRPRSLPSQPGERPRLQVVN
jgi:two-component system, NarL family, nitrate/nitrite response regulator NarL